MLASLWLKRLFVAVSALSVIGAPGGAAQENAPDVFESEQDARVAFARVC